MNRRYIPMAIVYDFDGTLARGNMQEHQFLRDIRINPTGFWKEVKNLAKKHQADDVLVYMKLMLRKAAAAGVSVRKEDFKKQGEAIKLFEGVEKWFDRISEYGRNKGACIKHFLVSSGNAEIVAGTSIASKFAHVYASKFMWFLTRMYARSEVEAGCPDSGRDYGCSCWRCGIRTPCE